MLIRPPTAANATPQSKERRNLFERLRSRASGTAGALVLGSALIGLSGYVFLAVIGHGRFDAATAAALSSTYLLSNILGPGVFIAAEQETSRVVSSAIALGSSLATSVRRLVIVVAVLGTATLLVLGVTAPALVDLVLGGQVGLVLALCLCVLGSSLVFYVRGVTSGKRRFREYALTLWVDGAVRIVGCVALAVAGTDSATAYALALCAGPLVAGLCTYRVGRTAVGGATTLSELVSSPSPPSARPPPSAGEPQTPRLGRLFRGVSWLLVASVCSFTLANLAPVVVTGVLTTDRAIGAGFATAVVLTRVPLLVMGAVQAVLLPRLTAAVSSGDRSAFTRDVIRSLAVIAGLAVLALLGTWGLGRLAIRVLFGEELDTTTTSVLLGLTGSAMLFMAVLLLQPALLALNRHGALVVAWLAGAAAFGGAFALPLDPVSAATVAQLAGPAVTLTLQLLLTRRGLRGPAVPSVRHVLD